MEKKIPPQNPQLDPINKIEKNAPVAGRGKSCKFLDENPTSCLVRVGEIPCAMSTPVPMKADTEGAYTTSLRIHCMATREENTSPTTPLTPRNKTRTTETGKHPTGTEV